jgi:ArsR family metal-binding transcriptional regulator
MYHTSNGLHRKGASKAPRPLVLDPSTNRKSRINIRRFKHIEKDRLPDKGGNVSMTEQHKVNQAENALESLGHAVDQAESHPSDNKIEEADESFRHTEIAVRQAVETDSGEAERLTEQLQEERAVLGGEQE